MHTTEDISATCSIAGLDSSGRDVHLLSYATHEHISAGSMHHGQFGHVINLPQDVGTLSSNLPRDPTQLEVLVVRKEGTSETSESGGPVF